MKPPMVFHKPSPSDVFQFGGSIKVQLLGKFVEVAYEAGERVEDVARRLLAKLNEVLKKE